MHSLCGMFTAGAVLANPYAVVLLFIYGIICAAVSSEATGERRERDSAFRREAFSLWVWAPSASLYCL